MYEQILTLKKNILDIVSFIKNDFTNDITLHFKNNSTNGFPSENLNNFSFIKNPKKETNFNNPDIEIFILLKKKRFIKTKKIKEFFSNGFNNKKNTTAFIIPYIPKNEYKSKKDIISVQFKYEIKVTLKNHKISYYTKSNKDLNFKKIKSIEHLKIEQKFFRLENKTSNLLKIKKNNFCSLPKTKIKKMMTNLNKHLINGDCYVINGTFVKQLPYKKFLKNFTPDFFIHKWFFKMPNFGFFFIEKDLGIMSFSPERFIQKKGSKIYTQPIKGTFPINEYFSNKQNIFENKKERYEHSLTVDLLRNDFNSICIPGSVKVLDPFFLKKCGEILQMQSTISGKLKKNIGLSQILQNTLPCGSITGAPKLSSCALIKKYEPTQRGYYTGIYGLHHPNGDFDSSILIRSLFFEKNQVYAGVGAGLTTLSNHDCEINEFILKLNSFL